MILSDTDTDTDADDTDANTDTDTDTGAITTPNLEKLGNEDLAEVP